MGGARVSDKFGISFDLLQEGVDERINARANQLAGAVTDTTYRQIKGALNEGIAAGETIPQLSGRIQDVFAHATNTRATRIARTEVISSFNGAQTYAAQSLPGDIVGGKEWISTRDTRTRSAHRGTWPSGPDGQAVPMHEMFAVGGEHLTYPGDPVGSASNVVNCRCTVAFLTPEEMAQRQTSAVIPPTVSPEITGTGETRHVGDVTTDPMLAASSNGRHLGAAYTSGNRLQPITDGKVWQGVTDARGAIDNVIAIPAEVTTATHGGGKLPIVFGNLKGRGSQGLFMSSREGAGLRIAIKGKGGTPGMTFAHEFGHFLDLSDFGTPGAWNTASGPQRGVMEALKSSKAFATLADVRALPNGARINVAPGRFYLNDHQHIDYLMSDKELWARGFAQYIAEKSGDKTMLRELRKDVGSPGGTIIPHQWETDDFAPIREAFDAMFSDLGLLR
jgi:hypothetical protein